MKIIAINSLHSDKHAIALVTEPPLTMEVFQEFERLIRTPGLQPRLVSGCLVIQPETYTPGLRHQLEQLLTESEDLLSGIAISVQKQAEIEQSEKELTLESAAAGFGLPIV